jgi:hypothetical protein
MILKLWYKLASKNYNPISFDSVFIDENDLLFGTKRLLEVDKPLVLPTEVPIRFLITSADDLHSWSVPEFGIKTDAVPGRLNQIITIICKPGIYFGQCSELCGVAHAFMPIKVQAISLIDFLDLFFKPILESSESIWIRLWKDNYDLLWKPLEDLRKQESSESIWIRLWKDNYDLLWKPLEDLRKQELIEQEKLKTEENEVCLSCLETIASIEAHKVEVNRCISGVDSLSYEVDDSLLFNANKALIRLNKDELLKLYASREEFLKNAEDLALSAEDYWSLKRIFVKRISPITVKRAFWNNWIKN